jgi:hypothetical protein
VVTTERELTHRDEQVRNGFLIACPSFAILPAASGDVPGGAVDNHRHEEDEVEPRERAPSNTMLVDLRHAGTRNPHSLEASDQTPSHGEEHVRHIVRLAHNSEPTVDHDLIARVCFDELGVLDHLPRYLRESVALDDLAFLSETDRVLLAVCAVPHPVEE